MWFKGRNRAAFTFAELLISMSVMALVGASAISALWLTINHYSQMDDYTSANAEMQYAIQRLNRDFALIGLGMPNNRQKKGSFSASFSFPDGNPPVMSFMTSSADPRWGGPASVAEANPANDYTAAGIAPGSWDTRPELGPEGTYVGPELYYTFAVPTGVKARFRHAANANETLAENNTKMVISELFSPNASVSGGTYLRNFQYDGRKIGLETGGPESGIRKWLLFPTLRLPMIAVKLEANSIDVKAAPENKLPVKSTIMGLDEIHLVQSARLYRNNENELVRVFIDSTSDPKSEVLARGIVGLQFMYNPVSRLLTMYMAAQGMEMNPLWKERDQPDAWPSWLPPLGPNDLSHRILVKSLTWRIRN